MASPPDLPAPAAAEGEEVTRLALDIELFRTAFDLLQQGVVVFDRGGRVAYANAAAAAFLQRPLADLQTAGLADWHPVGADGREIGDEDHHFAQLLKHGRPVFGRVLGDAVDGSVRRWLRTDAQPVHRDGEVVAVLASFTDVTAERHAADALQSGEAMNHELGEASSRVEGRYSHAGRPGGLISALADGVFLAQDGRFAVANTALPAMLGYPVRDFAGLPFEGVVAPEHLAVWNERYRLRVAGGAEPMRNYETAFLHADGTTRVAVELLAARTQHGGRPAVLGVVRNIAERDRAEVALQRRGRRLEALMNERTTERDLALEARRDTEIRALNVANGLPALNCYFSSDRRLQFANDAWLAWYGLDRKEAIGRDATDIIDPATIDNWHSVILRVLAGETLQITGDMTSASGETRHFWVSRIPDIRDGVVHGYQSIATDISELRRSQQHLQAANVALAEAEAFTRLIADSLPIRVAYWDRAMRLQFVNQAYVRWHATSSEVVIGREFNELFQGRQREHVRVHLERALAGEAFAIERDDSGAGSEPGRFLVHLVPDQRADGVHGVFTMPSTSPPSTAPAPRCRC